MYSVKPAEMHPCCTRSLSAFCKAGYVRIHLCTVSFGSVSPEARGLPCRGLLKRSSQWLTLLELEGRSPSPTSSIQPMPIIIRTRYATLTPSSFLLCTALVPTSYLHAYLTWPFPQLFDRGESTNKSSLPFRQSSPLIKIRSPSKLACFILLATWRRGPMTGHCQRKTMSEIRLHTNPLMGPTLKLPRQLACTVISQRPRSMAMFIVGRWKN